MQNFGYLSLVLFISGFLIVACEQSQSNEDSQSQLDVINGDLITVDGDMKDSSYASVAMLSKNGVICTGTCIGANVVLTAAHCNFSDADVIKFNSIKDGKANIQIENAIKHPDYSYGSDYDTQLLILSKTNEICRKVTPVCQDPIKEGEVFEVVGWGMYEYEYKGPAGKLYRGTNKADSVNKTRVNYSAELTYSDLNGDVGDSISGAGDSGGPLFVSRGGQRCVGATTSHGEGDGKQADTNIVSHLSWINEQAGGVHSLSSDGKISVSEEPEQPSSEASVVESDAAGDSCTPTDINWCEGIGSWDQACRTKCPDLYK